MADNKDVSETEDVPSDFFDDFNKEEFMEGLSVIDSWDGDKPRARINAEAVESVRDLRELIRDGRDDDRRRRSASRNLDDYIKPGSRRDINKTNEAIRRDKEVKVKQFLAKSLESGDDLRPPGTELDDFFDENKQIEKISQKQRSRSRNLEEIDKRREHPPVSPSRRRRYSQHRSPRRSPKKSSRRSPRRSPIRRSPRRSPFRRSPYRQFPQRYQRFNDRRFSPRRDRHGRSPLHFRSPRHSPRRSPRRSPRWERRSRSPHIDHYTQRARSRSPTRHDTFLYPNESPFPDNSFPPRELFPGPGPAGFPGNALEYSYQGPGFSGGFGAPYDYSAHPVPPGAAPVPMPVPQPVPAPVMPTMAAPAAPLSTIPLPSIGPHMVPAPISNAPMTVSPVPSNHSNKMDHEMKTPYDALAQLVAEGKLSKEDYLKLAPHKSMSARYGGSSAMEVKARVDVLTRCNVILSKLSNIKTPNRLMMNSAIIGPEPKALAPKYCSPLKRQATIDFHYTASSVSAAAGHNKQLIESIVDCVGISNAVARPKKKLPKNMKDAAVQTTKPYCDVCEIREATRCYDASTAIDLEQLRTSTHTQVVEQELLSSKAVFAPSGSVAAGAPLSIAHLTPAQLVSQLAARAKTLKQTEPPRRAPPDAYGYDGTRSQHYQGNYNSGYGRY